MSQEGRCTNPRVGVLIKDLLAGELAKPCREGDRNAFMAHSKECPHCWDLLVEHSAMIIVKTLRGMARKRDISFNTMLDEFANEAGKMIKSSKPKEQSFKEKTRRRIHGPQF